MSPLPGAPNPIVGSTYVGAAALGTAGVAGAAWVAVLAWHASGRHFASHDAVFESGNPFGALPGFASGWLVMVAAMMLPSVVGTVATRDGGATRLVVGYVTGWTSFGLLALAGDAAVHRMVDPWECLRERPYLVAAAVLVTAGLYQVSPWKRWCLRALRRGESGFRHTIACLGCCGGLMLTMFAVGMQSVAWMAMLTAIMVGEKTIADGWRVAHVAGGLLVAVGVLAAVSSGTLV